MDFITAVKTCFSKFLTLEGRARRSEYWWFSLACAIACIIPCVGWIFALVAIIPHISVAIRRLHDVGRSGAWLLLVIIPFGGFVLLYFYLLDSESGANEYGECPK